MLLIYGHSTSWLQHLPSLIHEVTGCAQMRVIDDNFHQVWVIQYQFLCEHWNSPDDYWVHVGRSELNEDKSKFSSVFALVPLLCICIFCSLDNLLMKEFISFLSCRLFFTKSGVSSRKAGPVKNRWLVFNSAAGTPLLTSFSGFCNVVT